MGLQQGTGSSGGERLPDKQEAEGSNPSPSILSVRFVCGLAWRLPFDPVLLVRPRYPPVGGQPRHPVTPLRGRGPRVARLLAGAVRDGLGRDQVDLFLELDEPLVDLRELRVDIVQPRVGAAEQVEQDRGLA